jgi:hypothetical protein
MCTLVEVDAELLDALVRLGWLQEADSFDSGCVGKAISRMLKTIPGNSK